MKMEYSKRGLGLTEHEEGCRLTAYLDVAGVPTIGYGHTNGVRIGDTCTQQQAEQWLMEDVRSAVATVNQLVRVLLTQEEFDSLVDFTFNVGSHAFLHSTLLRYLNRGDFRGALAEFQKWKWAGGRVVGDLVKRRQREAALFQTKEADDDEGKRV